MTTVIKNINHQVTKAQRCLHILRVMVSLWLFVFCFERVTAQTIATTPPMGWNSYNCFGSAVHEDEVKANADYVAKNLKKYGWQYIVVDFLWSYDNPPG